MNCRLAQVSCQGVKRGFAFTAYHTTLWNAVLYTSFQAISGLPLEVHGASVAWRVHLDEDRDASSSRDGTRLEHLNSRRVDRACRRRVADFFAHGPWNQIAYGTWGLTKQRNRELHARSPAFRGIPASSKRRCAELRRKRLRSVSRLRRKSAGRSCIRHGAGAL